MKIASGIKKYAPQIFKKAHHLISNKKVNQILKLSTASLLTYKTYSVLYSQLEENIVDKELCGINDLKEGEMKRF